MTPREAFIVVRNTLRVMRDSDRLDDIIEVGDIVGRSRFTQLLPQLKSDPELRALLAERPELNTRQVDLDALRSLPPGTLGRAFVDHLDRHGLSLDAINKPDPRPDDSEAVYLMRRFRGNHDLWHALLDLGVEGHQEVMVHAFTWGQLRLPISAMIILFGGLKHLLLEGRFKLLRQDIFDMTERGRRALPLIGVRWEKQWARPIDEVRAQYHVT